jgi:predicted cobalt transporter CbtA
MKRLFTIVGLLGLVAGVAVSAVQAKGVSPAQLQRAGWSCVNPAAAFPANPNVHCFPPGKLEGVIAGTVATTLLMTFATTDVNAEEAPLLGTERMIRADLFHNQPCPTDPPGGPPGAASSPPLYEWSYLGPRFGWDYYICHTFDSPW